MSKINRHLVDTVTRLEDRVENPGELNEKTYEVREFTALCREKWSGGIHYGGGLPFGFTSDPYNPGVCTKCQSKFMAKVLKENPIPYRLHDRLVLNTGDQPFGISPWNYKSVYPVSRKDSDEVIAFVAIDNGWGSKWKVMPLRSALTFGCMETGFIPDAEMALEYVSYEIDGKKKSAWNFASKEAALLAIPEIDNVGALKTTAEIRAEDEKELAAWAERRARNAEQDRIAEEKAAEFKALLDSTILEVKKLLENKDRLPVDVITVFEDCSAVMEYFGQAD